MVFGIGQAHASTTKRPHWRPTATAAWFAVAFVSFLMLDGFSISVGDDFGYMFTDSKHHACDGAAVSTLGDCLRTQAMHYVTTNGRFVVHTLVMAMLNLVPEYIYRIINALMFASLWLLTLRLGYGRLRNHATAAITLACLWVMIPDSGVVMLSLCSYSVNYMWTGTATLLLLLLAEKERLRSAETAAYAAVCAYALLCGSLQESFSAPLSAALTVECVFYWRKHSWREKVVWLLYIAGTAVCVAAPGNIAHFMAGGGLEGAGMTHKLAALAAALIRTPMPWLTLLLAVWGIRNRHNCRRFISDNRTLCAAIVAAVLFAVATFTSARQLFAPSLLCILLISRLVANGAGRWICLNSRSVGMTLACAMLAAFSGIYILRRDVSDAHNLFLSRSRSEMSPVVYGDASRSPYNTHPLLWLTLGGFAPDPWEGSHFTIPFDSYSRHGLSRLMAGDSNAGYIATTLPYPPEYIMSRCHVRHTEAGDSCTLIPETLDSRYGVVATDARRISSIGTDSPSGTRCEVYYSPGGATYIVVPAYVTHVRFKSY